MIERQRDLHQIKPDEIESMQTTYKLQQLITRQSADLRRHYSTIGIILKLFFFVKSAAGETIGLFARGQFVDELIDRAVHDCWQVITRHAYAMVGDAVLWIVIRADLLRTFAGSHL
jgi:hypothetical protein